MQQHPYAVLAAADVQGKLLLTPCPGTQDSSLEASLDTLKEAGASVLLTLMTTEELIDNAVENLPEYCQLRGIQWFHLPIEDDQAPGELFQLAWESNREQIKQSFMQGDTIAIHCKGGSGRTGLIAAQLLIECGVGLQDALNTVQALRPRAIVKPQHVTYIAQIDADTSKTNEVVDARRVG